MAYVKYVAQPKWYKDYFDKVVRGEDADAKARPWRIESSKPPSIPSGDNTTYRTAGEISRQYEAKEEGRVYKRPSSKSTKNKRKSAVTKTYKSNTAKEKRYRVLTPGIGQYK